MERGLKSVSNESCTDVITFRIGLQSMPNLRHFMIDWEINKKLLKSVAGTVEFLMKTQIPISWVLQSIWLKPQDSFHDHFFLQRHPGIGGHHG